MATDTLPNPNQRTMERRQKMILHAAYEVESLAALLQRAAMEGDCDAAWIRGAGVRLEELASIAMSCADDDEVRKLSEQALEGRLYGPEWLRRNHDRLARQADQ